MNIRLLLRKHPVSLQSCLLQARKLRHLILIFFILSSAALLAQQGTVTGRVTARDSALAGAMVQVKGTATAAQTDDRGAFSIAAPANGTLVFSSVGYVSQEIDIKGRR